MATDATVYILRQSMLEGDKRWVVFDTQRTLYGNKRESCKYLTNRWVRKYGRPDRTVRYEGIMKASEAAMTIADVKGRQHET